MARYHTDEPFRERILSRAFGYNVEDEVNFPAHDPATRIATRNRPGERVLMKRSAIRPTQFRSTRIGSNHDRMSEDRQGAPEEGSSLSASIGRADLRRNATRRSSISRNIEPGRGDPCSGRFAGPWCCALVARTIRLSMAHSTGTSTRYAASFRAAFVGMPLNPGLLA